ncbi:11675_t:CDS:1, partial [Acaulospora colombiana]
QTCKFDQLGELGKAEGEVDDSGSFKVENHFTEPISVEVIRELRTRGDTNKPEAPTPEETIYVTPDKVLPEESITLTPIDKIVVWFQATSSTGSMEGEIIGKKVEIILKGKNRTTQTYSFDEAGKWKEGPLPSS